MTDERKYETVRDKITDEEFRQYSSELAAAEKELQAARAEKKVKIADTAAKMNACQKRIDELAEIVHTGYKTVEVEVMVRMNTPRPGWKRYFRIDRTTVREEPMTWSESQGEFPFEDLQDDRPGPNQ